VVAAVSGAELSLPLDASVPVQPPEPVHAVALVELHVNTDVPPFVIDCGLTDSVAVGTTLTVTFAG
jgi:hypothetical protein